MKNERRREVEEEKRKKKGKASFSKANTGVN